MNTNLGTGADLLSHTVLLTSGGSQTTLMYKHNCQLRAFATYELLFSEQWNGTMRRMVEEYGDVAVKRGVPLLLDTETWRASANWYSTLQTPEEQRAQVHALALQQAQEVAQYVRDKSGGRVPVMIHGVVGPRKDAYLHDASLSVQVAREYHSAQVAEMRALGVGLVGAYTLTSSAEGAGFAAAAAAAGMDCMVSFTLDVDGRLPSGEELGEAIAKVGAGEGRAPVCYMVNCVHPRYIREVVERARGEAWVGRIGGVRANASAKSHAELAASDELDEGDAVEWAKEVVGLREVLPGLKVIGGCCGTGAEHCEEIAKLVGNL